MFALIGSFLCILAGFNVHEGAVSSFDFLAFGVALVAIHLAAPIAFLARRNV